jgi:hypothetical protein
MSLTKVSYSMIEGAAANVLDYGADPTGSADSHAAFAAAWTAIKTTGGTVYIPPGNYLLASSWTLDISSFKNIKITGYGATLSASAAVTSDAIRVVGSSNLTILDIEGLNFNHQGNGTVGGCFDLLGAHCVHIRSCNVEAHSTKAGWHFARLSTSVAGNEDFNSFWCSIENCTTRMRSGGLGTINDYGIIMEGGANATKIINNQFNDVEIAVYIKVDPVNFSLPNGCLIQGNDFESVGSTAIVVQGEPGELGITGLRVLFNRVETCPTFFSFDTSGAAALQHSMPPFLMGNYCTTGSVTTWVANPTNYAITTMEAMYPGFGPVVNNNFYQNGKMTFVFDSGNGFITQNTSGTATYESGYWNQGTYRYWTNTGDGKFYVKNGVPSSATDGTVVGTQT